MIIDDRWKDELMIRERITDLELLAMSEEHRNWIKSHPKVFVHFENVDCTYNLLHRDNKAILMNIKKNVKQGKN